MRHVLTWVIFASVCVTGCGTNMKTEKSDGRSSFSGEYIISAREAKSKIGDESVQFVDARGEQHANRGTIEGAVVTDWMSLSTCQEGTAGDPQWGLIPPPEELTVRLRQLGIEKEKEIIVLGQPEEGWGEDGRVLWELREAGCENIKMVDGGIMAMKDIGAEFVRGGSTLKPSQITAEKPEQTHNILTEELQNNYEDYKIVDVRTEREYEGAVLYNEAKGGHLPGAVNLPYAEVFQADGTLKDNTELTEMFEACGLNKSDRIVTYCTGGIRSAYIQLLLEMCGYENTYSYGQSFWRWAVVGEVEK